MALSDRATRHPATAWIVLAVALMLTVLTWYASEQMVTRRAHDRFLFQSEALREALLDRIRDYEVALRGGVGLFNASESVHRSEWRRYIETQDIQRIYPGIQGLGFSQVIPAADLARHQAGIRAEGFPTYRVWPEGERPLYTAIVYLEPFDWRNQRAFGYDMFSEPVRREAMERARDSGKVAVSEMVRLVQETELAPQKGFLMYQPVYRNRWPVADVEQRRAALTGYVYSPFRMNDLMRGILGHNPPAIDFQLYDGATRNPDKLLYLANPRPGTAPASATATHFSRTLHLDVGGHTWTLALQALPGFISPAETRLPAIFGLGGLFVSLLLFLYARTLAGQQRRAEALADGMTAELRDSEEHNRTLVEFAPDAIIVIDERGLIQDCNPAAQNLFGYRSDELTGVNVNLLMPSPDRQAHDGHLARYLAGGEPRIIGSGRDVVARCKDGSTIDIHLRVGEQRRADGSRRFIGFCRDISQRKRDEAELEAHRKHLEDMVVQRTTALQEAEQRARLILDSSGDGLYGIDLDGRFTFVNPAACEMLGYGPGELEGRPVHASIHHTQAEGTACGEDQCHLIREMRLGHALRVDHDVFRRRDGEPLHVTVASQPMWLDGELVGAVVSFTDIQDRIDAEMELRRQAEELRKQYDVLEQFNRIMVGRELDMIRLKQRINELAGQLGQVPPYDLSFTDQVKTDVAP